MQPHYKNYRTREEPSNHVETRTTPAVRPCLSNPPPNALFTRGIGSVPGMPGNSGTDWRAIVNAAFQAKLTVVIYMGVSSASHIQKELLHGLPASTPVAIIQNASLPQQRHVVCTLDSLVTTLQREQLASPCVIVVGEVMQGLLAAQQQDGNLRHQGKLT